MPIYFIRMIELLGIESLNGQQYLHVQLHTTQPIRIYWHVESTTAQQLLLHCDFQANARYRISLKTVVEADETVRAQISKTYLNTSSHFHFTTSTTFQQQLTHIKSCASPIVLLRSSFVMTPEQFLDAKAKEPVVEKIEKLDLSKVKAATPIPVRKASVARKTQHTEAPVFTYHASNNSYASFSLVQGSKAV